MNKKPPTTPSSSSLSRTQSQKPQPLTETPIRTIQDHGTVGAIANYGSDLSYDLSSTNSSFQHRPPHTLDHHDDDDDAYDHKNRNEDGAGTGAGVGVDAGAGILPPNEVVLITDKKKDYDDDNLSLDDEEEKSSSMFKGQYGVRNRKKDSGAKEEVNAVIIQDLHQLQLDKSRSDGDDHGNNHDNNGSHSEGDDDDDEKEEDKYHHNGGNDDAGQGNDIHGSDDKKNGLDLENVAEWIKSGKCKKIVVLSGAGVSCSAGIPDFRTPGSGLYDNLEKYNLPYPEAVFDLSFYQSNPLPFISLAKEMWPGTKHSPTLSHSFISLLCSKNLLMRNYTQNIDGLELLAGVCESKLVECHGHFRTSSCIACGVPYDGKKCQSQIVDEEEVPICPKCGCLVKPDIVFFGESLPVRFKKLLHSDLGACDLLIVMGTSLKVAPVSLIPEMVSSHTPRVLFNRELVGNFIPSGADGNYRDIFEEGDCDDSVRKLCSYLGWEDELLELNEKTRVG